MVYANDQWVLLPVRDLYDSQIMAMAINAAKDMYDKGLQEMKDFNKEYGDFMTPIAADLEKYDKAVTGRIRNVVNAIYAAGGDPLRDPLARMIISRELANMPTKDIAMWRLRAENAKEYYKNMATLKMNDKFDKDFSEWLGEDPNQWADDFAGITSPTVFKTLKEATDDWYNNRTPRDLTPEEKKKLGLDPRYKYTGYFDSDLMNVAKGNTPGWQGTPISQYYRELAKRKLLQAGITNPTADQIESVLQRDIANAQQEWLVGPTQGNADEFVLDDYRTKNDIKAHSANAATDYYYDILPYADTNGDGKLSAKERSDFAKLKQLSLIKGSKTGDESDDLHGYNIPEDVYLTSLAKASGMEYLSNAGTDPGELSKMLKAATKRQNESIKNTRDVFAATGMFISPEKIEGLIQYDSKDGKKFILNTNYFKNLHDLQDVRTSYKGWLKTGSTKEQSKIIREENKQLSKDIISGIKDWNSKSNKNGEFKLQVVPISDNNGNNVYGMVGDDGRWHTYARVRVYMSNGKETKDAGTRRNGQGGKGVKSDIPVEGREMALEVGLHSNKNAATPDLSVSAREDLGLYGFDATKSKIGLTGNSGWPYGTNILKD